MPRFRQVRDCPGQAGASQPPAPGQCPSSGGARRFIHNISLLIGGAPRRILAGKGAAMIAVTAEDPLSGPALEAAAALRPAGAEGLAVAIALERAQEHALVLIARDDARPVGCAVLIPAGGAAHWAEVQDLYVCAPLRGQGIATRLMAEAEARALALGASVLRVETAQDVSGAAAFYRRIGYADCPAFGRHLPAKGSVFLEKRLAGEWAMDDCNLITI